MSIVLPSLREKQRLPERSVRLTGRDLTQGTTSEAPKAPRVKNGSVSPEFRERAALLLARSTLARHSAARTVHYGPPTVRGNGKELTEKARLAIHEHDH